VTRDEIVQALGADASERLSDAIDAYVTALELAALARSAWDGDVASPAWKATLDAEKMAAARRADLGLTATKAASRAPGGQTGQQTAPDRVAAVTKLRVAG
jgi:hypothetical protein